jgi:mannosylglycerate hydrolase
VLELVAANGFREYYDPDGQRGYGSDRFSWTAALFLDLAMGG